MHEMVTEWRKPVNAAYIVAGLPEFSTLSTIADIIKQRALEGFLGSKFRSSPKESISIEADVVSPGGKTHTLLTLVTAAGGLMMMVTYCAVALLL
jgi:hypothetical protein